MWKVLALAGAVSLLALLTACGGAKNRGSTLTDFMKSNGMAPFTIGQVFGSDVTKVVVACPFDQATTVKDALGFDYPVDTNFKEDEQLILAVAKGTVVEHEQMSRQAIDFCAGSGNSPLTLTPATRITLTTEKWSDGADYPLAHITQ